MFVGWDPREVSAFAVARRSALGRLSDHTPVRGLMLGALQKDGLYRRPIEKREEGRILWDVISDAPMSTEHACARFLAPHLAGEGWCLFMDGDVLVRADLATLFDGLDPAMAAYCVKHEHDPAPGPKMADTKMDGQIQTAYPRKNWSSVMAINCDHPANRALTLELVNSAPGRDLHALCWLDDGLIGALDPAWNHLVGVSPPADEVKIAHFTLGVPDMTGWEEQPFADEWWDVLAGKIDKTATPGASTPSGAARHLPLGGRN